jgi:hypothetical protein
VAVTVAEERRHRHAESPLEHCQTGEMKGIAGVRTGV